MANIDDILKKSQAKLEKHGLQKKIQRSGPKRPWQEGLFESTSVNSSPVHESDVESEDDTSVFQNIETPQVSPKDIDLKAPVAPTMDSAASPTAAMAIIENEALNASDSKRNDSVTITEQKRNNSVTESVTVTEQLRNSSVTSTISPPHANRLAGNKLTIVKTILDFCQERGSANTGPVSREVFELRTGIDGEVIRVTCVRLVKEGYLNVLESKRGNGGYTVYELHPNTHSQLISGYIRNNSVTIAEQKRNNSVTESVTDSVTTAPSKIDSKNYNNLTNYLESNSTTATWFKELDFSKVSPIGPMMVNATIRSLVQQKLNPEIVQDFINRFTSWVATQSRVSNAVGLFCDKLKELANEGDSSVLACMTEEERQVEVAYAAQVEKARLELELIQKARSIEQEKAKEADFEKGYSTATESEKELLVPTSKLAPEGSEVRKGLLKASYFSKEQS